MTSSSVEDFLEHVRTPLNACSLESLPASIQLDGEDERVWPLMLGCYELDEDQGQRRGRLDLYAVAIPKEESDIRLGEPTNILGEIEESSGILDGKWYQRQTNNNQYELYYATAHASGEVIVHKVEKTSTSRQSSSSPLTASRVGSSSSANESELCLALSWDLNPLPDSTRIISTYSNGQVAIHQVNFLGNEVQLIEQNRWDAHKIFQSPAEVWSACFTSDPNIVLTGGDEGYLKIWNLLAGTTQPMHVLKNHFQAGVTVLSPHPRRQHLVACGSYDETVSLLDLRSLSESQPKLLCHSEPLGGGMWRIKWHPIDDEYLLLGAMHGGCRVVKVDGIELIGEGGGEVKMQIQQEFTKHKSMAYGADWLVSERLGSDRVQAAVSCSFYDRAMYLWRVN